MSMQRLGLGAAAAFTIAVIGACDNASAPAATLVAPDQAVFSRTSNGGGKPHSSSTTPWVTVSPTNMTLAPGSGGWFHVTLYDKNGNALPDDNGSIVWFGCTPADPALQNCMGYVGIEPKYPNLRDVYVSALGSGTFSVWADDGAGHRATVTVTVQ